MLGTLIVISLSGAGLVWNTAVEHGSQMMTSKSVVAEQSSTVAVKVYLNVLRLAIVAPSILTFPPVEEVVGCKLKKD